MFKHFLPVNLPYIFLQKNVCNKPQKGTGRSLWCRWNSLSFLGFENHVRTLSVLWGRKKTTNLRFLYLPKLLADSDDIYGLYQAISQVFMGGKIFLEYSSFVEISARNWFFHVWENAIFGQLTTKNAIFRPKMTFFNQYAGFGSK